MNVISVTNSFRKSLTGLPCQKIVKNMQNDESIKPKQEDIDMYLARTGILEDLKTSFSELFETCPEYAPLKHLKKSLKEKIKK